MTTCIFLSALACYPKIYEQSKAYQQARRRNFEHELYACIGQPHIQVDISPTIEIARINMFATTAKKYLMGERAYNSVFNCRCDISVCNISPVPLSLNLPEKSRQSML